MRRIRDHGALRRELAWWLNLARFLLRYSVDLGQSWLAGLWDCVPRNQVSSWWLDQIGIYPHNAGMEHRKPIPRKKASEKRPHLVVVRLNDAELTKLVRLARMAGGTKSEAFRSLLEKA